jgi:hypothetical protein
VCGGARVLPEVNVVMSCESVASRAAVARGLAKTRDTSIGRMQKTRPQSLISRHAKLPLGSVVCRRQERRGIKEAACSGTVYVLR